MFILMGTPEAYPFARTGNLGEVIHGLASSLVAAGHRVSVVLPLYRQVREQGRLLAATGIRLTIPLSIKTLEAEIYHTALKPGFDFYFIAQDSLYNRDGLYGTCYGEFQDNAERFIFFSRAVLEMVEALELEFDVCHCHDWQTGLVPVYGRTLYREQPRWQHLPVVYSVHNVGYQGIFPAYDFPLTGLDWSLLAPKALEFYGKINFMKGGLVFADLLTTVSARYREEILTPEFGFGLEGIFHERDSDLFSIPERVDYSRWQTLNNTFLAAPYDNHHLEGKKACKAHLLARFGLDLPVTNPLIGMNTRLYDRKGIDLVESILEDVLRLDVSFVLQGTGEERHKHLLQEIQNLHPNRMGLSFGYSEELAHQIIAGSDMFLMPSYYEPGGLDQLYCLRYGTVPIVRTVGGLDETIENYNFQTGKGSGFKFAAYSPQDLLAEVHRALALYRNRTSWETLMRRNMTLDFSWDTVVPQYVELYRQAQERRQSLAAG